MARIFTDHGGKILMETRATSLIYKGGRVDGVQAVNADGDKITINAKETILASRRFWRQDRNAPEDFERLPFLRFRQ